MANKHLKAAKTALDNQLDEAMSLIRQMQEEKKDEIGEYRTALADAICRPRGVVPYSAAGLLGPGDLTDAETRYIHETDPAKRFVEQPPQTLGRSQQRLGMD